MIPGFSLEKAEGLVHTTETHLGAPQFACHQSREDEEVVCAGWLARYGWDNIGVRIGLLTGQYEPEMLSPGDDWPELHETFQQVIEKLRASAEE